MERHSTLSVLIPDEEEKTNSIFHFHTSFWCLKWLGLTGHDKAI